MNRPRHINAIARLVLVWLVVTLGAATASPFAKPRELQAICTEAGQIMVDMHGEDAGATMDSRHGGLDCPACLVTGLPAFSVSLRCALPLHAKYVPVLHESLHIPRLTGAQMPPRGPPGSPPPKA